MTILGQGTTLAYYSTPGTPTTGSYIAIGEVIDLSGPSISRDTIETTVLDQATNHKTFIGGLIDSGEVTFDIQFDPTDTELQFILDTLDDGATADSTEARDTLRIVFTDGSSTTYYMDGVFTGLSINTPKDDIATASVSFKVSGAVTTTDPNA